MEKQSVAGTESISKTPPASRVLQQPRGLAQKYHWRMLSIILFVNDAVMITLGFRMAYFVRFELSLRVFQLEVLSKPKYYSGLFALLLLVWLIIFAAMGLYQRKNLLADFFSNIGA